MFDSVKSWINSIGKLVSRIGQWISFMWGWMLPWFNGWWSLVPIILLLLLFYCIIYPLVKLVRWFFSAIYKILKFVYYALFSRNDED